MEILRLTDNLWQTVQISELSTALIAFNNDFESASLVKDKTNPHLKNAYVSLDNLLNVVRPLLTKNGLSITQDLAGGFLVTTLLHSSGQFKGSAMPFSPMGGNNAVSELQKIGGGITYAKRYAVSALLSISVDTDDDGNEIKGSKEDKKQDFDPSQYAALAQSIVDGKRTWEQVMGKYNFSVAAKKAVNGMIENLKHNTHYEKEFEPDING